MSPLSSNAAASFLGKHRFCHVELRRAKEPTPARTARELRRENESSETGTSSEAELSEASAPAPSPDTPLAEFQSRDLLAVSGSGEQLLLAVDGVPTTFEVTRRKRDRLDIVLNLRAYDGTASAVLRQTKPLLGCHGSTVRTCRMSEGSLSLQQVSKEGESLKHMPSTPQPLLIRDLCGGARKETLFRAPIDLSGLAEWKVN
jgi:hypothetical protein